MWTKSKLVLLREFFTAFHPQIYVSPQDTLQ